MRNHHLIFLALVSTVLTGCASYTIKPTTVSDDRWGTAHSDTGYVFFQPELYFLVTRDSSTNKADQFTVKPIYLPNYKRAFRVETQNFLAKSDFTFNFADGWQLTGISDKSDNTTVANAIAGQLGTVLSAASKIMMASPTNPPQQVFLLRPKYDPATGQITALVPIPFPEMK